MNVQEVATGQPITDWTLESLSGFDYTQEVPEPGPLVLILILVSRARCCDTETPNEGVAFIGYRRTW